MKNCIKNGKIFLLLYQSFQCLGNLIGTRGGTKAAVNTVKAFNGIRNLHSLEQRGNALCVARATADKRNVNDHIAVNIYADLS